MVNVVRATSPFIASTRASALFGLHLPAETIRQIIHHAAEGVGGRVVARLLESE